MTSADEHTAHGEFSSLCVGVTVPWEMVALNVTPMSLRAFGCKISVSHLPQPPIDRDPHMSSTVYLYTESHGNHVPAPHTRPTHTPSHESGGE